MIKKVWKSAIVMILAAMMFATHSIASSGSPDSGEQRDSTYSHELGDKADIEFRGPRRGPDGPMAQESREQPEADFARPGIGLTVPNDNLAVMQIFI